MRLCLRIISPRAIVSGFSLNSIRPLTSLSIKILGMLDLLMFVPSATNGGFFVRSHPKTLLNNMLGHVLDTGSSSFHLLNQIINHSEQLRHIKKEGKL